jgi:hypothetical protein
VQQLSVTERMFFRDAIRTLLAWDLLKDECIELDLIRKILESEIKILDACGPEDRARTREANFRKSSLLHCDCAPREKTVPGKI